VEPPAVVVVVVVVAGDVVVVATVVVVTGAVPFGFVIRNSETAFTASAGGRRGVVPVATNATVISCPFLSLTSAGSSVTIVGVLALGELQTAVSTTAGLPEHLPPVAYVAGGPGAVAIVVVVVVELVELVVVELGEDVDELPATVVEVVVVVEEVVVDVVEEVEVVVVVVEPDVEDFFEGFFVLTGTGLVGTWRCPVVSTTPSGRRNACKVACAPS